MTNRSCASYGSSFDSPLLRTIVAICVFAFAASCGGKQAASDPSSSTASTGTSAISFSVEWEPPPVGTSSGGSTALSLKPMAPTIDVCTDYGIDTVTMRVLKGTAVLTEQAFPCGNHSGMLSGVPTGDNLILAIRGSIGGTQFWNGESGIFNLAVGETHNAGKVSMIYTGLDKTAPYVNVVNPADNSFNVPETGNIQIRFSERMAKNTVIDNDSIVVVDNTGTRVSGSRDCCLPDNSATFIPTNPLALGGKYTVTVNTSVTDMAGNPMGSPYSSGFHTRFRGKWGIPIIIETKEFTTGNGNPPYLDVALSDQGDAFTAWEETIIGPMYIYATRYNSSKYQWETPQNIYPVSSSSSSSRVAVDNAGNAIAVFVGSTGTKQIFANRYSAGNWTGAVPIDLVQGFGDFPVIAMDSSGNALVSYVGKDTNNNDGIYINQYSPGTGSWTNAYGSPRGDNCVGSITSNKIGYIRDYYGYNTSMSVYSCDNLIYANKSYRNPIIIGVSEPYYYGKVDISIRNNKAVVVWDNSSGLWSSFYDGSTYSGTWSGPVKVSNYGSSPSVAMNENGDIIVVWGGNDNVYASHATFSGKLWGTPPINLSGGAPYGSEGTKLGMDKDGNAIAVWQMNFGWYRTYISKRYDSGTKKWDTATDNVSENNPNLSTKYLSFSMNESGNAVAMWFSSNVITGSPTNVHANFRYK